jgi:hypothetical protein
LPKFDRAAVFASVEASSRRFESYTPEQRKKLRLDAKTKRNNGSFWQWLQNLKYEQ